jgi:hypothetical protein
MKYGEHLKNNIAPDYGPEPYLAYERLDQIITELMETKPSRYVYFGFSNLFACIVWINPKAIENIQLFALLT